MRVRVRLVLAGLAAVVAVAAALLITPTRATGAQGPSQPIVFSHKLHAGDYRIDCQYCHADARRSFYAGIPSVKRCMGCHQIVGADRPEVQKLQQLWKDGRAIPWVRVHRIPGFVYFPHRRHVQAGSLPDLPRSGPGHGRGRPGRAADDGLVRRVSRRAPGAARLRGVSPLSGATHD